MRSANGGWLMPAKGAPRSPGSPPRIRRRNLSGGTGGSPSGRRRKNKRRKRRHRNGNQINLAGADAQAAATPSTRLKLMLTKLADDDPSDEGRHEHDAACAGKVRVVRVWCV
mgnify:CR=1 FL=1